MPMTIFFVRFKNCNIAIFEGDLSSFLISWCKQKQRNSYLKFILI